MTGRTPVPPAAEKVAVVIAGADDNTLRVDTE